ncbi:MAG: adenine-specific methyltransferase EcoRI family protein [Oscillospiraceae bacterium]|nr:adenine-specific methyltransferase EcoRI family protein [Oscillospiraceae bacterium]
MAGNKSLNAAAKAKQDEFYTQLTDIEKELRYYKKHFRGKTVLCNCDDPYESNFFRYFAMNFNFLGLKKLIATCYTGSPIAGRQLSLFDAEEGEPNRPYKAVITTVYDKTGDGGVDMFDVAELFRTGENELTELEGDGDFSSPECLALLDEADIVVTNPPFSLFREYLAILVEHKKSFLILGSQNNITYKEVFPLLMANKVWLGNKSGDMAFAVPDDYEPRETRYWQDETGQKWRSLGNICWFTNLDIRKRHEELILVKYYNPDEYPHYDNYDAIEVSKVSEIPLDYEGVMGVPITFLDSYNPDQFEILGITDRNNQYGLTTKIYTRADGSNYSDCNRRGAIRQADGTLKSTYARLLIRNLHPEPPKKV